MSEPPSELEAERDELRREVGLLSEQLKHLVKAEHALTRARRESERQLDRIKRLADFAFDITGVEAAEAVFTEARDALLDQFELEDVAVLRLPARQAQLGDVTRPEVMGADSDRGRAALAALEGLGVQPHAPPRVFVVVPIRPGSLAGPVLLLGWSGRANSHHRELPHVDHLPFLQLFANHVTRALDNAHYTSELKSQGAALTQANQQLQKSLKELERTQGQLAQAQKLEALGRLAGGIAHDFNNLLTVIVSHAELTREAVHDAAAQEDLAVIVDAASRATEITRRLLAFGRKQDHRRQVVDLNLLTTDLSRMLRRLIGEDVVLQLDLDPGIGRVNADAVQVEQILMNLVVNARDAMPRGGKLTIETRHARHADRSADGRTPVANFVALSVRDTGTGMDEATRRQLFEPFFTTKPLGKGTGLGLATVYGLVRQNEGEITVQSSEGQGSCFTVLLPTAEGSSGAHARPAPESRGVVLVVEDEDAIRRMVSRVLRKVGFEVTEARDGQEALETARRMARLDVVVTDVVMPVMGGPQLVTQLRAERPGVRVVFMSGHTFDRLDISGLDACVETFLAKPFAPDQLQSAVEQAMGDRRDPAALGGSPART